MPADACYNAILTVHNAIYMYFIYLSVCLSEMLLMFFPMCSIFSELFFFSKLSNWKEEFVVCLDPLHNICYSLLLHVPATRYGHFQGAEIFRDV